ncbi:MAG: hypothetical protein M1272_05520 [Firmicutes bacterium]|nr:hypothetical protein [Bacillota bacterium]
MSRDQAKNLHPGDIVTLKSTGTTLIVTAVDAQPQHRTVWVHGKTADGAPVTKTHRELNQLS